jgi:hypothetical protein
MAYDFPPDLIAAQQALDAADAAVNQLAARWPSSLAVLAGEATVPDGLRDELAAAREERLRLLEARDRHTFWAGVDDRYKAGMALWRAARGAAG